MALLWHVGCRKTPPLPTVAPAPSYDFGLAPGFPVPVVPADNQMTPARVELGRRLFYDRRLSVNGSISCADCHRQKLAFTDGRRQAVGATGEVHPRNAMSLTNVAYNASLTWADPFVTRLEQQAFVPMFNEHPVEMGLRGVRDRVLEEMRGDPDYRQWFDRAFPDSTGEAITIENMVRALAAFERILLSFNSPYDRMVLAGQHDALSERALQGMRLFFSEKTHCAKCHAGFNFSGPVTAEDRTPEPPVFHNTALYNLDGKGAYPGEDTGLMQRTGRSRDMGRFRAPTLRNIGVTGPYMHDGSVDSLEDVLDHYAAGGRTLTGGRYRGIGNASPLKSELLQGFEITAEEKRALVEFLESLTDREFLERSDLSNPWN